MLVFVAESKKKTLTQGINRGPKHVPTPTKFRIHRSKNLQNTRHVYSEDKKIKKYRRRAKNNKNFKTSNIN